MATSIKSKNIDFIWASVNIMLYVTHALFSGNNASSLVDCIEIKHS